ncbi:hypothetical protein CSUI_006320, partial [Cystoisospora suis]
MRRRSLLPSLLHVLGLLCIFSLFLHMSLVLIAPLPSSIVSVVAVRQASRSSKHPHTHEGTSHRRLASQKGGASSGRSSPSIHIDLSYRRPFPSSLASSSSSPSSASPFSLPLLSSLGVASLDASSREGPRGIDSLMAASPRISSPVEEKEGEEEEQPQDAEDEIKKKKSEESFLEKDKIEKEEEAAEERHVANGGEDEINLEKKGRKRRRFSPQVEKGGEMPESEEARDDDFLDFKARRRRRGRIPSPQGRDGGAHNGGIIPPAGREGQRRNLSSSSSPRRFFPLRRGNETKLLLLLTGGMILFFSLAYASHKRVKGEKRGLGPPLSYIVASLRRHEEKDAKKGRRRKEEEDKRSKQVEETVVVDQEREKGSFVLSPHTLFSSSSSSRWVWLGGVGVVLASVAVIMTLFLLLSRRGDSQTDSPDFLAMTEEKESLLPGVGTRDIGERYAQGIDFVRERREEEEGSGGARGVAAILGGGGAEFPLLATLVVTEVVAKIISSRVDVFLLFFVACVLIETGIGMITAGLMRLRHLQRISLMARKAAEAGRTKAMTEKKVFFRRSSSFSEDTAPFFRHDEAEAGDEEVEENMREVEGKDRDLKMKGEGAEKEEKKVKEEIKEEKMGMETGTGMVEEEEAKEEEVKERMLVKMKESEEERKQIEEDEEARTRKRKEEEKERKEQGVMLKEERGEDERALMIGEKEKARERKDEKDEEEKEKEKEEGEDQKKKGEEEKMEKKVEKTREEKEKERLQRNAEEFQMQVSEIRYRELLKKLFIMYKERPEEVVLKLRDLIFMRGENPLFDYDTLVRLQMAFFEAEATNDKAKRLFLLCRFLALRESLEISRLSHEVNEKLGDLVFSREGGRKRNFSEEEEGKQGVGGGEGEEKKMKGGRRKRRDSEALRHEINDVLLDTFDQIETRLSRILQVAIDSYKLYDSENLKPVKLYLTAETGALRRRLTLILNDLAYARDTLTEEREKRSLKRQQGLTVLSPSQAAGREKKAKEGEEGEQERKMRGAEEERQLRRKQRHFLLQVIKENDL